MHVQSNGGWLGGWLGGRLGGWLAGRPKPPPPPPRWLAQLRSVSSLTNLKACKYSPLPMKSFSIVCKRGCTSCMSLRARNVAFFA